MFHEKVRIDDYPGICLHFPMKTALVCLFGIALGAGAMLVPFRIQRVDFLEQVAKLEANNKHMSDTIMGYIADEVLNGPRVKPLTAAEITALKKKYPLPNQASN